MARRCSSVPETSAAFFGTNLESTVPVVHRGPRRGDLFRLRVERLDGRGIGVAAWRARLENAIEPRVYRFEIERGVPGDVLDLRVTGARKGQVSAVPLQWVHRVDRPEPACAHFEPDASDPAIKGCGGCTLQGLRYPDQLNAKAARVRASLATFGLVDVPVREIVPCVSPLGYRNKMEFSFATDADGGVGLGLHPAGYRYSVVELRECPLFSDDVRVIVPPTRAHFRARGIGAFDGRRGRGWLRTLSVREGKRTGERLLELTTDSADLVETVDGPRPARDEAALWCETWLAHAAASGLRVDAVVWTQIRAVRGERTTMLEHVLFGGTSITEALEVGGARLSFEVHPRAFFQPNTLQAEVLYTHVLEAIGSDGDDARVLDLYCGTGTIGLCVSRRARTVTGVDLQADAVRNANANAQRNGISNATFHAGDAAVVLATLMGSGASFDVVVVDPPRAGLSERAREEVRSVGASKIVMVSCNPDTMARDVAELKAHGYDVAYVVPVDMFPQTLHVETVTLLTRVDLRIE